MILDKNRVFDGWDSQAAGMDAGRRPSLIEANQCAKADNVVFRGGVPKSRPGIPKRTLVFEEQIYYGSDGDSMGPTTVTDAIITLIDTTKLISNTAKFSQKDVGSFLLGDLITPGTTIASVESATQITMSMAQGGGAAGVTITIVGRTNPVTFTADHTAGLILSSTANFTVADVGRTITGGSLPAGTYIIVFLNKGSVIINSNPTTEAGVTLSIPARVPNLGTSDAFYNEPFQCACYYAPARNNECIMATIGGRLFQITPDNAGARVREIQLSQYNPDPVTFTGGHTAGLIIADQPVFTAEDIGFPVSGGNLGANAAIATVITGTQAVMNASPAAESGITFTLHRQHSISRRNRRTIKENWMVQADRWHITQDNESKPIIFDGVSARRAGDDEIIVGQIMAYGIGRIIVTKGRNIYFGDLFGSHAGDPSESVLKFTETKFLNEGFPAEIPYSQGEITAAAFFPSQDTATAQGELVIFTESGAVTFDLHLPRDKWKDSTFQQISLLNSTANGQRAVVMVNSDLWIRDNPGWRAYRQARALALGWYQLPQSTEVTPWIDADTPELLRYGSGINFQNRLLVTCNPRPNQGRLYHNGILSLDFDVLSAFGQATRPAWDGHWSGLRTLQLVAGKFKGRQRAFALALDEDDKTALYEITKDETDDASGPITSEVAFRSFNFDAPFNEKNLYGADVWLDEIRESVSMEMSFRPDSMQTYLPWKTFKPIVPSGVCGEITCGGVPTIQEGFSPRVRVPKPANACDDQTNREIRRGYEFQPKLRWTGHTAIRRLRLQALQVEEDPTANCNP